jgi:iron(III) transport system substrate-binding protein
MDVRRSILCNALFVLTACLAALPAHGQSDHTARLVEGAKKEGKLVWYTAMNIRDAKPILDAFAQEYPFIKTELARLTGERLINRIRTETLAGSWLFDVASTNGLQVITKDKMAVYVSPEANAYAQEFKDPEGRWTAYDHNYYVFAYNGKAVADKDAPRDYEDLLNPKWKGQIVLDPEDYEWYGALAAAWGKEKTDRYMRRLAAQNVQWRHGHGLIGEVISTGEVAMGFPYANQAERLKAKGSPIDWVPSFNPTVTAVNVIGLSAKPLNPNAGKLFVDFLLSKKGQEIIRDMGRLPVRRDVKPLSEKADPEKLKLQPVTGEIYINIRNYAEQFRKLFGL